MIHGSRMVIQSRTCYILMGLTWQLAFKPRYKLQVLFYKILVTIKKKSIIYLENALCNCLSCKSLLKV